MRALFVVMLVIGSLAVACSTGSTTGLGTRSDAIAYFASQGFSGAESSGAAASPVTASAAPLWVAKGPGDALAESSGAGNSVDWVSISVDAQGSGRDLLAAFLTHFAPAAGGFYSSGLTARASGTSHDKSRTIGGRRVHIPTISTA